MAELDLTKVSATTASICIGKRISAQIIFWRNSEAISAVRWRQVEFLGTTRVEMCARAIQSAEIISDIIRWHLDADFIKKPLEISGFTVPPLLLCKKCQLWI